MLRVFAPPEDRVKGIFHGASSPMQERKMREMEKKKAYAAELQAQMREREQQKQMERMHRFGAPAGAQGSSGFQQAEAVPANFSAPQPPYIGSSVAADPPAQSPDWLAPAAAYGNSSPTYGMTAQQPQQGFSPGYQQQQQQASWQLPGPPGGPNMPPSYTSSPNTYGSPSYARGLAAEAPARSYQEQLGYSPGGWPGAGTAPPAAAQLPAYMHNSYDPYSGPLGGPMGPGRQPYAAMAAGPPPDPYGSAGMYGNSAAAGPYGAVDPAAAPPPSWGQPPARFPPGGAAGSIGNYSTGYGNSSSSNAYGPGPPAAAGSAGAGGRGPPAWDPNQAPGTGVPGAAALGPSAAAVKSKKDAYRAELEAQIRDKAARKAAEKSALAAEDARKEAEQAGYDPWGRAGAGAPMRNAAGQVVANIRGGKQPMQQQEQYQQQQQQPYQQALDYPDDPSVAAEPASYWGPRPDAAAVHDRYQQQQQGPLGGPAASRASAAAPAAAAGPPPLLHFRSDKAFMTADEVERKQQRQAELQRELAQQIEEKKRRKELEQKQAEEEARREEERFAAEQARLAEQFQQEQDKQKMKDKQSTQKEEQVAGAWNAAKEAAEQDRRKTMEERRRSHGQILQEPSSGGFQWQSSIQQNSSQPGSFYNQGSVQDQQASNGGAHQAAGGSFQQTQQAAADGYQQFQVPQQQERQQMMMEALRLEENKTRQMAAQEVERLRAEMAAQAAALRDVVERQGGEVAALRAAAAVAEAESMAAKSELLQVRQDMHRRSQEMQHETLSTILADYGDAPATRIQAAYHPSPIRRIELDLPPPAARMRQSVQLHNAAAYTAQPPAAAAAPPRPAASNTAADGFATAEREGSAVDLLESLLQQGKQQQQQQPASHAAADLAAQPPLPRAAAGGSKSWLNSVPANQAGNIRGSMLVSESTFIFPAGIPAEQPQASDASGDGELGAGGLAASDNLGSSGPALRVSQGNPTAGLPSSSSAMDLGSHWGLWQHEQPTLQRHTTSAPGSSNYVPAGPFAAASQSRRSNSINRRGLVTPGGSDLTSVVDRNADRLQMLNSMPTPGDSEALDEFLAKFVSKTSQPNQRNIATPPSRLLSANNRQQYHTVQLLQQPSNKTLPSRYGSIAEDSSTAAGGGGYGAAQGASALAHAAEAAGSSNLFMGIADTLDMEVGRVGLGDSMRPPRGSTSGAAVAAQQRLLRAGTSGVEASDPSMLGTSHWVSPGLESGL